MRSQLVTALSPTFYAGRTYQRGQSFTVKSEHAHVLTAIGKVQPAAAEAPAEDTEPIDNHAPAEMPSEPPKRRRGRPRKADTEAGTYRRRDLRADE